MVVQKYSTMKYILALLCLSATLAVVNAQEATDTNSVATNSITAQLTAIREKVMAKANQGKKAESDFAEELKALDDLYAKNRDQKTDELASVLGFKTLIYLRGLGDQEKGKAVLEQIKNDFPGTKSSENAAKALDSLREEAEAKKVFDALVIGATFPGFTEKDLDGKPLAISDYKGKVLLVDFWATWCGPCIAELPNVKKVYDAYRTKGFDVLGISLDNDEDKLKSFLKENEMPWRQYFDGQGWNNKLGRKYGIRGIPATFLLDGNGKIIDKNLRGEKLEQAVEKAVGKK
jgi:thiol-disulfide isomerase/thioredoxin